MSDPLYKKGDWLRFYDTIDKRVLIGEIVHVRYINDYPAHFEYLTDWGYVNDKQVVESREKGSQDD